MKIYNLIMGAPVNFRESASYRLRSLAPSIDVIKPKTDRDAFIRFLENYEQLPK